MTTATLSATVAPRFLWLEITGRCQLTCVHCSAESSPLGSHGTMTIVDWQRVIDSAVEQGVDMVQFIGGEPTIHPGFSQLVSYALAGGLQVEVYTNLLNVPARLWEILSQPGVRLATSYYSDDPVQHDAVTARRGSHRRTRTNISEAVRRGIPLRVGVIGIADGQRVKEAQAELTAMGVTDVGYDRMRAFGRGAAVTDETDTCGHCGHGAAAIGPDGMVSPCVFTRHVVAGNVKQTPLAAVVAGDVFQEEVARLDAIRRDQEITACSPPEVRCGPKSSCQPSCTPSCSPMRSSCKPKNEK
ncbi:radical SAM protein [Frankia sp. Cas3]|uniref:radical SAM protein n=1 Tax=Frankia sp. Cas3 TaxID=3073926 RepID=UPI002AD4430A|nr:radical SAM protein [Frankia sp. Cas3]